MFLKSLTITSPTEIIRDMEFKSGLNLIIDDTPSDNNKLTGNNVGKTTVLKLVDYCLAGQASSIYTDTENKKECYSLVKDYLIQEEILITLTIVENMNKPEYNRVVIKRNFLARKKAVRNINGKEYTEREFEEELFKLLFPKQKVEKPTFRQIISHNIRYKDESINKTLNTLDRYSTDAEYESLYLFLLGCTFNEGAKKQELLTKLKQEETYKDRLEKKQTKTAYEIALAMIEDEIKGLDEKKAGFNLDEDFEKDLDMLNAVKYQINKLSSSISKMMIRKELIEDAKKELEESVSVIDMNQLKILYSEAKVNVSGIQKTFSDLVTYHNTMLVEKAKFITEDLPKLEAGLREENKMMSELLRKEKKLSEKVLKGDSFDELEKTISELNEKYRAKGEYENIISQINETENNIISINNDIQVIDDFLFSHNFEEILKTQINKFNKYFSTVSQELYGERYALKYDIKNKNGKQVYRFSAFNANMSSGKKQGEILCFDLAYILFADEEKLPCMHFLLNDKKELMHDNQLGKVADFIQGKEIQLVVSMLRDKLPVGLIDKSHIVVELSQECKLFKIENRTAVE